MAVIDVTRLGADPTNASASDTAFAKAHAAAAANGGSVYVPTGNFKLTVPWNVSGSDITVVGDGPGSIISQSVLSSDTIQNVGNNNRFTNFQIKYPSLASAGVGFNTTTSGTIFSTVVDNVHVTNAYDAFHSHNENFAIYSNIFAGEFKHYGFNFDTTGNVELGSFNITQAGTPALTAGGGIIITGPAQGLTILNGESYGCFSPLVMGGSAGGITGNPAYCHFSDVFFDSGTQSARIAEAYETTFVDCWFSNGRSGGGFNGLQISAGSGIKFIGCEAVACGSNGFALLGGKNVAFSGCSAIANSITAGSAGAHGFNVSANVNDFIIRDCIAKNDTTINGTANQGWGILINSGTSDRYIVQGNLVSTNVTAGVLDLGSGSNKLVANNY